MNKLIKEFVSDDRRVYKFKIGTLVASSFAGFIGGMIAAGAISLLVLRYFEII